MDSRDLCLRVSLTERRAAGEKAEDADDKTEDSREQPQINESVDRPETLATALLPHSRSALAELFHGCPP
jgi:hypothetical protein